ncbi:MAG: transglutaminase family protein [Hyphomicrobiaceae bacterium]
MRLKIRHDTIYSFAEPARSALHVLRLTPRNLDSQFVRRWRIEIDGDARLDRGEDAHGNITHTVFVDGPLETLRISVTGEVDTGDTTGIMRGTVERLPQALYLRETDLTTATGDIRAFAEAALAAEAGDHLATMHRMMAELHTVLTITERDADFSGKAGTTFADKTGNVQDAAHLLVVAARCAGIPARLVTGYLFEDDEAGAHSAHAWMEAAFGRVGWIGFDVTRKLCVTDRYVRVATGADYLDAAPVRGASLGGGAESREVSVRIEQGRQVIEG